MPKFELEYNALLNTPLIEMGMGLAFDPEAADFSRLTSVPETHITRVQPRRS